MSAPTLSGKRSRGFTLIELIVSAAILAIVTLYLTDLFTRQSRAYAVVDNVTEIQQNLRAIAHLMERELRSTGMLVPEAGAFCGFDNQNTADVVFVTDSEALAPGGAANLGASLVGNYTGSGVEGVTVTSTTLDGDPFYDNDNDGVMDTDFQVGGGAIVFDPLDASRGTHCGIVVGPPPSGTNVNVDFGTLGGTPLAGTGLQMVPAHVYRIVGTQLTRDGVLLADNVEDLQFAAFFDLNDNELMDGEALEYAGSSTGPVYDPGAFDNTELREVRVTWAARTRSADQDLTVGTFQAAENRVAPAGTDGFRRRVYTTRVRPRNVGQRQGT
jgi:prepilin-type N-terminal cleavage/methylation domain-containing protein